ncbi:MAG: hypothetical protein GY786_11260 [Proteobacteria bacterium]|nr:hypothetical protein [Pseudomonadota bacterium]
MKKQFNNYLFFGLATGLLLWSVHEFLLLTIENLAISKEPAILLLGGVFGGIFGSFMGMEDGFLNNSTQKLKKGFILGGSFGLFSGLICFFLFNKLSISFQAQDFTKFLSNGFLNALRWFFLLFFVGIAIGLRDRNQLQLTRGIFSGVIAGFFGGALIGIIETLVTSTYWARGISFTSLTVIFSLTTLAFSKYNQKQWIKVLNGSLEGQCFELSHEIHFIGTQNSDDINFTGYKAINSTHAKLLRYSYGYSLVDNDPFGHTYVNFRNVAEQPLKNGDILKIGTATFQYCVQV